jgi:hypothetical protein
MLSNISYSALMFSPNKLECLSLKWLAGDKLKPILPLRQR